MKPIHKSGAAAETHSVARGSKSRWARVGPTPGVSTTARDVHRVTEITPEPLPNPIGSILPAAVTVAVPDSAVRLSRQPPPC